MNAQQQKYAQARKEYDEALAKSKAFMATLDPKSPTFIDDSLDYDDKVGTQQKYDALHAAEKELIEWGHNIVRTLPQYKREQALLEEMYKKVKYHPRAWDQLVALTLKLEI
jgi:hypothetical protein